MRDWEDFLMTRPDLFGAGQTGEGEEAGFSSSAPFLRKRVCSSVLCPIQSVGTDDTRPTVSDPQRNRGLGGW